MYHESYLVACYWILIFIGKGIRFWWFYYYSCKNYSILFSLGWIKSSNVLNSRVINLISLYYSFHPLSTLGIIGLASWILSLQFISLLCELVVLGFLDILTYIIDSTPMVVFFKGTPFSSTSYLQTISSFYLFGLGYCIAMVLMVFGLSPPFAIMFGLILSPPVASLSSGCICFGWKFCGNWENTMKVF